MEARAAPRLADNVIDLVGTLLVEHAHAIRATEADGSGRLTERVLVGMQLRLARCRRDLADPSLVHLPVGAIGGRWGFADPAHFSHAFKEAYGMRSCVRSGDL